MCRGPVRHRAPCLRAPFDGAAFGASCDLANPVDSLARFGKRRFNRSRILRRHADSHTDPAVECARHFLRLDIPLRLQERHQSRLIPGIGIDHRMAAFRQNARHIFEQPATCDMRHAIDLSAPDERQQRLYVYLRWFQKRVDQDYILVEQCGAIKLPAFVSGKPADEREAVRMHARGCQPQDYITGRYLVCTQNFAAFDRAHAKSSEIVILVRIHARHLGGFSANQRASRLLATFGYASDNRCGDIVIELSGRIVIKKEKRFCALHDQIIHAHRDQIDADAVMPPAFYRQFQLRADTIIRGDEKRIVKARSFQIEKSAKPAKVGISSGPPRGFRQRGNRPHQRVSRIDGNACLGIGIGFGLIVFVIHFSRSSDFRLGIPIISRQKTRSMTISVKNLRHIALIATPLALLGAGWAFAQIEGPDRGIRAIASSGDFEVRGIEVNVTGDNPYDARKKGWEEAQRLGWKKLWKDKRGGETSGLSDGTLNGIVSAVVVEEEQIGPKRYIARLGVLFDRARAGQLLGVKGISQRSAPLLLLPVYHSAGAPVLFEQKTPWQKAWATFRTSESRIDYVRPSGIGGESLLLNAGQLGRRNRSLMRTILDEFGAADLIIPVARVERLWPGGPVVGHFSARYGIENRFLGSFTLRTKSSDGIDAMMKQAVNKIDELYQDALNSGRLRVDARLLLEETVIEEEDLERKATAAPPPRAATSSSSDSGDGEPSSSQPEGSEPSNGAPQNPSAGSTAPPAVQPKPPAPSTGGSTADQRATGQRTTGQNAGPRPQPRPATPPANQ